MKVFERFSDLDLQNYDFKKEKYDDIFIAVVEYLFRASIRGIDLSVYDDDGVSSQEINFKNPMCEKLFLLFIYLNSNGFYPLYVKDCLEYEFLMLFNSKPSIELLVFFRLLSFVEMNLDSGYKRVVKKIADVSMHYCNDDVYDFCKYKYSLMS